MLASLILICAWTLVGVSAIAQEVGGEDGGQEKIGWFNTTELSAVVTDGNAKNQTIGFRNLLARRFASSRFRLRLESTTASSADDRFAAVDPATVVPGVPIDQQDVGFILVQSELKTDLDKALVEGRYDRDITESFFWHVGAGWDRNDDAGIVARYQMFAGVGNVWFDRAGLEFSTAYGLSYNKVEEKTPDPEKDTRFSGVRFEWNYLNAFGKTTEYRNNWSINANLSDLNDYRYDMTQSIRVSMSDHLALQVSLQWLFENRPALEDVNVVLFTDANGNVVFPCATRCTETTIRSLQIRKKQLDSIFNSSLVVDF